ncbi:MAG: hypothetical protein ACE5DX_05475 [Candidatus Dojkabacteria bacterium]
MKVQKLSTDELRTLHGWLNQPGYEVFEKLMQSKLNTIKDRAIVSTGENDPVVIALNNRKLYGNKELLEFVLGLKDFCKKGLKSRKKQDKKD